LVVACCCSVPSVPAAGAAAPGAAVLAGWCCGAAGAAGAARRRCCGAAGAAAGTFRKSTTRTPTLPSSDCSPCRSRTAKCSTTTAAGCPSCYVVVFVGRERERERQRERDRPLRERERESNGVCVSIRRIKKFNAIQRSREIQVDQKNQRSSMQYSESERSTEIGCRRPATV
jgi:hypothetical protein